MGNTKMYGHEDTSDHPRPPENYVTEKERLRNRLERAEGLLRECDIFVPATKRDLRQRLDAVIRRSNRGK